jgi:hypothetical protein
MGTSGTYTWSLTANGIINEALEDLNVIVPGGTPASAITTSSLAVLNRLTKALSTRGIRVWSVDWVQKTFSAPSEVVGTDTKNYTCILGHTAAATNRPITGANYTTNWIEKGVSGGVWGLGTGYTTPGDFDADANTIEILQAFIRHDTHDTPLYVGKKQEYFNITDKTIDGKPSALYYDKQMTGHIYLHPQPDFANYADYVLHYLRESYLEDFAIVANDPDFQSMYMDYLVKALRYTLAPKYKKDIQMIGFYKSQAEEAFTYLKKKETSESSSETITPSFSTGNRMRGSRRSPTGSTGDISIDSP